MVLSFHDVARTIDISALKLDTGYRDLCDLVDACKKYDFGCAFIWQDFSRDLRDMLKGTTTEFGTSLGFPTGHETTAQKVREAEYFVSLGADQIDMVINIGFIKSGWYDRAREDLMAVREATRGFSLKVIIEAMLLTDEEIVKASTIVRECGCDYVKSGTGFSSAPTTLHHVALMKHTVGDACKIKAAGGVRDVETLAAMYALGVERFGIGLQSSIKLMEDMRQKYPAGIEVPNLRIEDYLAPGQTMAVAPDKY